VYVDEVALVEEAVDRGGEGVADAGDGADGVRPRPQVRDLPEELEAVPFFLEGVVVLGAFPDDFQIRALNLYALILALAGHKITGRSHRRTVGGLVEYLLGHVAIVLTEHNLNRLQSRAIGHREEAHVLGVSFAPHPALDDDLSAVTFGLEDVFHA
jgi:hypothetical protein